MKTKIKLLAVLIVASTVLFESCHRGSGTPFQTPRKGKHGGKHRIKTDMGGYL